MISTCSPRRTLAFLTIVLLSLAALSRAETPPLLELTRIETAPGAPVQLRFEDRGTGATEYQIEFAPGVETPGLWVPIETAVITPLGNGVYSAVIPNPQIVVGFYRVRASGGTAGEVIASFASTAFQVNEGGSIAPTVNFSSPINGTLRYRLSGTVGSGEYFSTSGEIVVNGTTATIPVSLPDDQDVGQLRYLTLTLEGGTGYKLGAQSVTTINVEENDADWQGLLLIDNTSIGFVLSITESNGIRMANLKSDGFGFFPTTPVPMSLVSTPDFFNAASADIPIPPASSLLSAAGHHSLELLAVNGVTNHLVSPVEIQGTAMMKTLFPERSGLNLTNVGTFLLTKPPALPATNEVTLIDQP